MSEERIDDAELYARMAAPYDDNQSAAAALERFMEGVSRLREEHRIADMMVIAVVHGPADMLSSSMTRGSREHSAAMAAAMFERFATPVIEQARRLRAIALGRKRR